MNKNIIRQIVIKGIFFKKLIERFEGNYWLTLDKKDKDVIEFLYYYLTKSKWYKKNIKLKKFKIELSYNINTKDQFIFFFSELSANVRTYSLEVYFSFDKNLNFIESDHE
jgi:hypothetical protein